MHTKVLKPVHYSEARAIFRPGGCTGRDMGRARASAGPWAINWCRREQRWAKNYTKYRLVGVTCCFNQRADTTREAAVTATTAPTAATTLTRPTTAATATSTGTAAIT